MSDPFRYSIGVHVAGAGRDERASESWWVGLDRAAFRQRAAEEQPRMRANKQVGDDYGPWLMGGIKRAKARKRKQERDL